MNVNGLQERDHEHHQMSQVELIPPDQILQLADSEVDLVVDNACGWKFSNFGCEPRQGPGAAASFQAAEDALWGQ